MTTPLSHEIETDCTLGQTEARLRARFYVEWAQGEDADDLLFIDEIFVKNSALDPFKWTLVWSGQRDLAEAFLQGHRRHAMLQTAYNDEQRWSVERLAKMREIVEANE